MTTQTEQPLDIEGAAQGGFALLERDELFRVAKQMGVKVAPAMKDDSIRDLLMQQIGEVPVRMTERQTRALPKSADGIPNLTSNGKWGGKYRRIKLIATEEQAGRTKHHPVRWENSLIYIPFNQEKDVPYPHYNVLKDTIGTRITSELHNKPNGEMVAIKTESSFSRLPFEDMGVTPGTEHLPESLGEYFRVRAEAEDNFRGMVKNKMINCLSMLRGPQGPQFYKDKTDEDIRQELLSEIGIWEDMDQFNVAA